MKVKEHGQAYYTGVADFVSGTLLAWSTSGNIDKSRKSFSMLVEVLCDKGIIYAKDLEKITQNFNIEKLVND